MRETCRKCWRTRPDYIADPTCVKGGYCEWELCTCSSLAKLLPDDVHEAGCPAGERADERPT